MDLGITDKVALVSASSRGLGHAVAMRLAKEGAKVAICARDESALQEAALQIRAASNSQVFAAACDVSDADSIAAFCERVNSELGPVEILVANAGGPAPGTFDSLNDEQWREAMDLNLMSAVRLIRAVLPSMKNAAWGRILLMASISVKQPLPNLMLSNALRAAALGMIKTLADEVAGSGILVNALCPGFIATGRMESVIRSQAKQAGISYEERLGQIMSSIPVGRLGSPEEFASAAAFLVSERASFISGATLLADGGMYRGLM